MPLAKYWDYMCVPPFPTGVPSRENIQGKEGGLGQGYNHCKNTDFILFTYLILTYIIMCDDYKILITFSVVRIWYAMLLVCFLQIYL